MDSGVYVKVDRLWGPASIKKPQAAACLFLDATALLSDTPYESERFAHPASNMMHIGLSTSYARIRRAAVIQSAYDPRTRGGG